MSGLEESFARVRAEENARVERHVRMQLEKYLAYALCATCGEQLGEDMSDITQEADEETGGPRTIHKHCEATP